MNWLVILIKQDVFTVPLLTGESQTLRGPQCLGVTGVGRGLKVRVDSKGETGPQSSRTEESELRGPAQEKDEGRD